MKHIIDYIFEKSKSTRKSNPHKLFQKYFDNFDFDSIPHTKRDKDVADYEEIAKSSRMATEASIEDGVIIEANTENTESVSQVITEEQKWKEIMKLDFEDLGISSKGRNGLKLDMRLDGFRNYEYSNHKPCIYFRVGSGEYDFLPMIISDNPYIPYSFEQTISDDELLWVYSWVKSNHIALLKFANEKIGYRSLFAKINENINFENDDIEEGKAKIVKEITGLERW